MHKCHFIQAFVLLEKQEILVTKCFFNQAYNHSDSYLKSVSSGSKTNLKELVDAALRMHCLIISHETSNKLKKFTDKNGNNHLFTKSQKAFTILYTGIM